MVDILAGAFHDVALNDVLLSNGVAVTELPDAVRPKVQNAALNYGTGMLEIGASETLDLSPVQLVNQSQFFISNDAYGRLPNTYIYMTDSTLTPVDSTRMGFKLTERSRVDAIRISGTSGGDGTAVTLSVESGAFRDLVANSNMAIFNLNVLK